MVCFVGVFLVFWGVVVVWFGFFQESLTLEYTDTGVFQSEVIDCS